MQSNGGLLVPPLQFLNASLPSPFRDGAFDNAQTPPPEVLQQTLPQALSESWPTGPRISIVVWRVSSDLPKTFASFLCNVILSPGIAENLSRAAPALADPKC